MKEVKVRPQDVGNPAKTIQIKSRQDHCQAHHM